MGEIFGGFAGIVLFIFAVALGIVWIILPFAVLGIRNRLDRVLVQLERIQKALEVRAASGGTLQNEPETCVGNQQQHACQGADDPQRHVAHQYIAATLYPLPVR